MPTSNPSETSLPLVFPIIATDVSAGATFAIGPRKSDRKGVRFLVTPEIGY